MRSIILTSTFVLASSALLNAAPTRPAPPAATTSAVANVAQTQSSTPAKIDKPDKRIRREYGFFEPEPIDFDDHDGYTQIFDGKDLKGWDGDPSIWQVEDGAIVGTSTKEKPVGNTYIVYRGLEAHDFDLKLEIKVENGGGSGIQYRSKTGLP